MRRVGWILGGVLTLVVIGVLVVVGVLLVNREETDRRQEALAPFYATPDPLPTGPLGAPLRSEQITEGVELTNGTAWRILYLTEDGEGAPRVSGGRLFVPDAPAPPGGRPVVS